MAWGRGARTNQAQRPPKSDIQLLVARALRKRVAKAANVEKLGTDRPIERNGADSGQA